MSDVTPLSAAEVAAIAQEHQPQQQGGVRGMGLYCLWCGGYWPCRGARLLATLAARDAEIARLRGLLREQTLRADELATRPTRIVADAAHAQRFPYTTNQAREIEGED